MSLTVEEVRAAANKVRLATFQDTGAPLNIS